MMNNSIALGTFDGLHLGHREVLFETKDGKGQPSALLFTEHPQAVVRGETPPALFTEETRDAILREWGVTPFSISFKEICDLSPEDFFYEILLKRFGAVSLSCGEDYTFGKKKRGNTEVLKTLCAKENIPLHIAKTVCYGEEPISSTRIRAAIEEGRVEEAEAMLGRAFSIDFPVVHGDARGRTIDCPTINQRFPKGFVQLKRGVYVTCVTVDGKQYAGVTNFGIRPTVGTEEVLAETFILGLDENLYGKRPLVEFLTYLRPEQKFQSLAALREAIQNDSHCAEEYFKKTCKKGLNIVK